MTGQQFTFRYRLWTSDSPEPTVERFFRLQQLLNQAPMLVGIYVQDDDDPPSCRLAWRGRSLQVDPFPMVQARPDG